MSLAPERVNAPAPARRAGRTPRPAPRRWPVDAGAALAGVGFGATVALAITAESRGSLAAPGGTLTFLGRLSGLTGTYLLLVMVLLIARIPAVERAVGQDRLLRWHRRLGGWPLYLLSAHAVLITVGYAEADRTGALHQLTVLWRSYPDVVASTVGLGLLVLAGVTSIRAARRRMRYETWWAVHLYTYLALALSFAHQLADGASFVGHPLTRWVWSAAWAATAGVAVFYRLALPAWRSLVHGLRVVEVRPEGPGVVSLVCRGRWVHRLSVSGGQFFQWRFLAPGMWWQAHPYSLSAMPRPPYLRVTVKDLGDQSRAISRLRPGTRIAIEGPYGAFTRHARQGDKVLLVAAGVGITPLRALLEDLPAGVDASVIVRASSKDDLLFREEMRALMAGRPGHLHELVGSRRSVRLDARRLLRLVPDIAARDVYVCGPEGFTREVRSTVAQLGVSPDRIHHEAFAF